MISEKPVAYEAESMANTTPGSAKSITMEQLENGSIGEELSPEHRDYLIQRHGTVDLMPLPFPTPDDPLNWPTWKVSTYLYFTSTEDTRDQISCRLRFVLFETKLTIVPRKI